MTFRSDATEGVWSPTQNVAVQLQTEANVVAIFFFHQCGFYDPTHHIRGCQKIIWNFALKGRALVPSVRKFGVKTCFFWILGYLDPKNLPSIQKKRYPRVSMSIYDHPPLLDPGAS